MAGSPRRLHNAQVYKLYGYVEANKNEIENNTFTYQEIAEKASQILGQQFLASHVAGALKSLNIKIKTRIQKMDRVTRLYNVLYKLCEKLGETDLMKELL